MVAHKQRRADRQTDRREGRRRVGLVGWPSYIKLAVRGGASRPTGTNDACLRGLCRPLPVPARPALSAPVATCLWLVLGLWRTVRCRAAGCHRGAPRRTAGTARPTSSQAVQHANQGGPCRARRDTVYVPITDLHLGLMIPLGRRWKSYSRSSTTTVWPALFPP